jgi:hypothetical protein
VFTVERRWFRGNATALKNLGIARSANGWLSQRELAALFTSGNEANWNDIAKAVGSSKSAHNDAPNPNITNAASRNTWINEQFTSPEWKGKFELTHINAEKKDKRILTFTWTAGSEPSDEISLVTGFTRHP